MKKLNKFELSLILVTSILNLIAILVFDDVNVLGIIASITGVICVVMTAKGHISCYWWGIINIIAYVLIAWQARFYGEVIENLVYYLPMQFVGIYLWKKNLDGETNIVRARRMTIKEIIMYAVISVIGIIGFGYFLESINSYQPFLDSATNILAVMAMFLSVKRFTEQWAIWIVINIISIYMWTVALIAGEANSLVMILMWSAYLINAFYGYINWRKLESEV